MALAKLSGSVYEGVNASIAEPAIVADARRYVWFEPISGRRRVIVDQHLDACLRRSKTS